MVKDKGNDEDKNADKDNDRDTGKVTDRDTGNRANLKGVHGWLVLWKTFHILEAHAVRSIESLSICPSDFGVLEVLLHKGPMPINTIGKKVLLTSGSITSLVDRLERRGFVERFQDSSDRRIRLVKLTDTGRTLIQEAFARHEVHLDEAVSDLGPDELAKLIELLKKLGHGAEARLKNAPREVK